VGDTFVRKAQQAGAPYVGREPGYPERSPRVPGPLHREVLWFKGRKGDFKVEKTLRRAG